VICAHGLAPASVVASRRTQAASAVKGAVRPVPACVLAPRRAHPGVPVDAALLLGLPCILRAGLGACGMPPVSAALDGWSACIALAVAGTEARASVEAASHLVLPSIPRACLRTETAPAMDGAQSLDFVVTGQWAESFPPMFPAIRSALPGVRPAGRGAKIPPSVDRASRSGFPCIGLAICGTE
jgi:hypothetical protein